MSAHLFGPINKSLFTQEIELITKLTLQKPELITMHIKQPSVDHAGGLYATINSKDYNLSTLMKRANFSHILLNEQDSNNYLVHREHGFPYIFNPVLYRASFANLTMAEKLVVVNYTASSYELNHFLYNHTSLQKSSIDANPDTFKKVFLDAMLLASALNKMALPNEAPSKLYRGEGGVNEIKIQARLDAVNNGNNITEELGFMSTSNDFDIARIFSYNGEGKKKLIIFNNAPAKDVSALSLFPSESEYILLPSEIEWEKVEESDTQITFYANVLASPNAAKDMHTMNALHEFHELYLYTKQQGIGIDALTPSLEAELKMHFSFPDDTFSIDTSKNENATLESALKNLFNLLEQHQFQVEFNSKAWDGSITLTILPAKLGQATHPLLLSDVIDRTEVDESPELLLASSLERQLSESQAIEPKSPPATAVENLANSEYSMPPISYFSQSELEQSTLIA